MKPFRIRTTLALLLIHFVAVECTPVSSAPAPAGKPAATNEYHGVKVVDPFQWLENFSDPGVQEWSRAQNQRARALLDKSAVRPYIEDSLVRLMTEPSTNYYGFQSRGGKLFFLKFQPPAQQPLLILLGTLTNLASERILVDPNKLSETGAVSIDWYVPSLDGKTIAVSLLGQRSSFTNVPGSTPGISNSVSIKWR